MARLSNTERDQKKADALALFIRGYSFQSISEMENIKISVDTLRGWAKKEDWEEQKQLQNISPREIKAMILKNVAAIKSGKAMPYKPDDISKLAAAWDKMEDIRKQAVQSMEAFDNFIDWMMGVAAETKGEKREKLIDKLQDIREYQTQYINTLL